jgi:hypothetical protein
MGPQHPDSSTDQAHSPQHHQTPPPPLAQTVGFKMRRLQEGYEAKTSPSHVQMDEVFTLESHMRSSLFLLSILPISCFPSRFVQIIFICSL